VIPYLSHEHLVSQLLLNSTRRHTEKLARISRKDCQTVGGRGFLFKIFFSPFFFSIPLPLLSQNDNEEKYLHGSTCFLIKVSPCFYIESKRVNHFKSETFKPLIQSPRSEMSCFQTSPEVTTEKHPDLTMGQNSENRCCDRMPTRPPPHAWKMRIRRCCSYLLLAWPTVSGSNRSRRVRLKNSPPTPQFVKFCLNFDI
jgi:hypothetical protein